MGQPRSETNLAASDPWCNLLSRSASWPCPEGELAAVPASLCSLLRDDGQLNDLLADANGVSPHLPPPPRGGSCLASAIAPAAHGPGAWRDLHARHSQPMRAGRSMSRFRAHFSTGPARSQETVHRARALLVPILLRLPSSSSLPPSISSEAMPRRLLHSGRQQEISLWGKGDPLPLCFSYRKGRTGSEQPFHTTHLPVRKELFVSSCPTVLWFFLPPVFFCRAARLPCKTWKVKGSDPSSIVAFLWGHTNTGNTAFTVVQKCDFQSFCNSLLVLEAHTP